MTAILSILAKPDQESCSSPAGITEVGGMRGGDGPEAADLQEMTSIRTLNLDYLLGREIGTCTLLKELARGNMAVVFVAYQRTLKRQIAAKILPKSLLTSFAAELFRQEAESAAILSHPNIVTIYETGETDEFLYILMQLVKGRSLAEYLRLIRKHVLPSKRILPIATTLKIATEVLSALDYAHRHDIVHRDIKPANILLEADTERPLITDFGLATTPRRSEQGVGAGTPIYMAPEQMWRGRVDGRADIYAVGMMLYEMLVPNLPMPPSITWEGLLQMKFQVERHLFQKPPSQINPLLHREVDQVLLRALSPDPEKRYPSCAEFLECLKGYQIRHVK